MPDGRTHDKITSITTPIVGVVSYIVTKDIKTTAILMSTYLFASLMFNGDLDMPSKPFNRWWLFKMIWIPYQIMFNHRSIFTHGLVIGTVVRILYLGIIPFIILFLKGNLDILLNINLQIIFLILIGLELGSAIHTISDKVY